MISAPAASSRPAATRALSRPANPSGSVVVGSRSATTARYLATSVRARRRAAAPSRSTTVTAPSTTATSAGDRPAARAPAATRSRITGTTAGLALPPTLTSSAISPASAAPAAPQAPISNGGKRPETGYRSRTPGANRYAAPA